MLIFSFISEFYNEKLHLRSHLSTKLRGLCNILYNFNKIFIKDYLLID